MSRPFQLFGSLSKIEDQDDGSIMVFGVASSGAKDDAGETVLPEAIKAALPDYGRYPALREMHGLSAAGRTIEASVDEDGLTRIVAHVVDPVAIAKVKSKTYAGFSIGGKVLSRDPNDRTIITKLKLNEISLVDRPCNPEAAIDLWKADGAMENEPMAYAPTNDEVKAEAEAMAKAAGKDGRWKDFVAKAREALIAKAAEAPPLEGEGGEAEAEPVAKTDGEADGEQPGAAEEAEIEKAADPDPVAALAEALDKAAAAAQPAAEPQPSAIVSEGLADTGLGLAKLAEFLTDKPLAKGLWSIGWLADVIAQLSAIQCDSAWEALMEGDASPVPAALAAQIKALGATLVAMAQEEVAEIVEDMGPEVEIVGDDFAYAAKLVDLVKADAALMEKAGARNSKSDAAKIQGMHDSAVELGATCGDAAKATQADDLAKAQTENERLTKALVDAAPQIEALAKRLDEQATVNADLKKRLEQVENEPAMPRTAGSARAIVKADDVANAEPKLGAVTKADMDSYLASLSDHDRAMLLTKAALQLPMGG
jgi:hypothetical protein